MSKKQPEIVERELWDHYSELPNPAWYEYKEVIEKKNMRLNELKKGYNKLVDEYEWTSLVYKSNYSFQPILGEPYHLYDNGDKSSFLSLIEPTQWDKVYIGTFILLNNGKWEKV